jgi:hypothetical protein
MAFGSSLNSSKLNDAPISRPKRPLSAAVLLPPLMFLGAVMMAADFTAIDLRLLRVLRIPYPRAMDYAHLIIPAFCALLWLATVRRWPNTSSIASVLLCFALIAQIPPYAQRRIARIPVRRFLTSQELNALAAKAGFPMDEQSSTVLVAPGNEAEARDQLRRLRVLSVDGPG